MAARVAQTGGLPVHRAAMTSAAARSPDLTAPSM
jgi:hypothetical protein